MQKWKWRMLRISLIEPHSWVAKFWVVVFVNTMWLKRSQLEPFWSVSNNQFTNICSESIWRDPQHCQSFSPFSLSTLWGLQFTQYSVFGHYFEEWDISAILHVSIFFSSQNTVNSVISTWPIIMLLNLLLGDERMWVSFNSKWNVRKCWKCYQRQLFRDKIQRFFTFLRQKQRCGFSFALIPENCWCCWYPQFLMEKWHVRVTRNTFWPKHSKACYPRS